MRPLRVALAAVSIAIALLVLVLTRATAPIEQFPAGGDIAGEGPLVLRAARVIDGTGHTLEEPDVVVENGRIAAILELKVFRKAYRETRTKYAAGERDVEFPYGTYKVVRTYAVRCGPPPRSAGSAA